MEARDALETAQRTPQTSQSLGFMGLDPNPRALDADIDYHLAQAIEQHLRNKSTNFRMLDSYITQS